MHLNLENIADYQNFPKKIFTTKLACFNNAINYVINHYISRISRVYSNISHFSIYQQRLEKFELILKDFYDICIKIEIKITKTLSCACIQIHSPRKADTNH